MACFSLCKKFVWTQSRDFLDIAVTWIASLTGVYSCTECFPFSYDVSFHSQLKVLCIEKQVKASDWAGHCGSLTFWRLWKTYSLCFSFMNHVLFPFVLMAGNCFCNGKNFQHKFIYLHCKHFSHIEGVWNQRHWLFWQLFLLWDCWIETSVLTNLYKRNCTISHRHK